MRNIKLIIILGRNLQKDTNLKIYVYTGMKFLKI